MKINSKAEQKMKMFTVGNTPVRTLQLELNLQ